MKKKPDPNRIVEHKIHEHQSLHSVLEANPKRKSKTSSFQKNRKEDPEFETVEPEEGLSKKKKRGLSPEGRAIKLLAQREHSKKELLQKLILREVPPEKAQEVVNKMAELDLQSDQRFLESRVRQRANYNYGPIKAQYELKNHGFNEQEIKSEINKEEHQWQDEAFNLIERRYGEFPLPLNLQKKAFDLLLRRGYTYEQARNVIKNER